MSSLTDWSFLGGLVCGTASLSAVSSQLSGLTQGVTDSC